MTTVLRGIIVLALLAVYVAALAAVLHPHISPEYRAYYISRTSTDYNQPHYASTPEGGLVFSREGLPDWVYRTYGFSVREPGGRWTDENLGRTAGLVFNRSFEGSLCLDFTAHAAPWMVGQSIGVSMGSKAANLGVATEAVSDYRVQFMGLRNAEQVEFVLPDRLPSVQERLPDSSDPRRVGIDLVQLRLLPGQCSAPAVQAR